MDPHEPDEQPRAPTDNAAVTTLRDQMIFYRDQAEELCFRIMEALKSSGARPDLMAVMYKHMTEARKTAIDCAAKLAPYESPRLESIEVNKKTVIQHVIKAPTAISNTDDWLENAKTELKLLSHARQEHNKIIELKAREIEDGNVANP